MRDRRLSRRSLLTAAVGASAALALPRIAAPQIKKGASLRLWILKTYVEPTNKAVEAAAQRWAQKHGAQVTVEYFTFEDMQTKYVAAIENKNTPDVGQLETGAPARFAGMGQLLDLTSFARQVEGEIGKAPANVVTATDIYKEGIQPADTLSWTGSQNNEAFIAKKIAQTSNGPSITFAIENALAKATDAKDKKMREEALANHVALPHPAGPDGRRCWGLALSFGVFKTAKDPEAAMSLIAHLLSPEETVRVMNDSHGQFSPVLDKARAATRDYFGKNENYRNFGRAAEWFVATGWPGPVTAAAAEVQASNVLTDAPAKVIVDKWSIDQAIDWADKKIKEIYDTLGA